MRTDLPLDELFPEGHDVTIDGVYFSGVGRVGGEQVAVLGTRDGTTIGVELAFRMAGFVLEVVRDHPRRPIVLLVDTTGQRPSRRDELLGINGYMAHLAKCVDLARRQGHKVIGLVWSQAVSGGFLASSMLADACHALPDAEIRVMNLPAMSRVTKIPLERLTELAASSPVFAPGVANYHAMGAIGEIWSGDLATHLIEALKADTAATDRRVNGELRGGRTLANQVSTLVREAVA